MAVRRLACLGGISPEEIDYLCAAINGYFRRRTEPADVVWSYSGMSAEEMNQRVLNVNQRVYTTTVTIDDVSVAVPEPTTWALMILGFGGIPYAQVDGKDVTMLRVMAPIGVYLPTGVALTRMAYASGVVAGPVARSTVRSMRIWASPSVPCSRPRRVASR